MTADTFTYVDPFDPRQEVITYLRRPSKKTPADYATEDELRGLSRGARRQQRRPAPIRIDALGYDQRGRWHAAEDGAA